MSRLTTFGGVSRHIYRTLLLSQVNARVLRYRSDNSDAPSIPEESPTMSGQTKFKKPKHSHLYVWPNTKDKNTDPSYEYREDSDDDITARWGWKNDELDVEQLAGLPGPNDEEYLHMQLEDDQHDDSPILGLQVGRLRLLRDQIDQELGSDRPDKETLALVHENLNLMMRELSEISLLLKTMYPEDEYPIFSDATRREDIVYAEPEPSWGFKKAITCESLDSPRSEMLGHIGDGEITNALRDQYGQEEMGNSMNLGSITDEMDEQLGSWVNQADSECSDHISCTHDENQVSDDPDVGSPYITSDMYQNMYSESTSDEPEQNWSSEAAALQWLSSLKTEKTTSPSSTEDNPLTDESPDSQGQSAQHMETIHTYRPFTTIEVPANKPAQSLSSQANTEVDEMDDDQVQEYSYNAFAELTESESRYLMRLALKQALATLEEGTCKYKATVMVLDPEEVWFIYPKREEEKSCAED